MKQLPLQELSDQLDQAIAKQRQFNQTQEQRRQIDAALMAQTVELADQSNKLLLKCLELFGRKP